MDPAVIPELLPLIACPHDQLALRRGQDGWLECPSGHRYPVVDGIPVLLRDDVDATMAVAAMSLRRARGSVPGDGRAPELYLETLGVSESEKDGIVKALHDKSSEIDPVVQYLVGATCGRAYIGTIGCLTRYPIPGIPLSCGNGQLLVDVGCNWGRWSIAAARKGYRVIGIDPQLGAVLAAKRVARQMNLEVAFLCADARYLPFASGEIDVVFSYSVLQHFSPTDCVLAVRELGRVLRAGGRAMIQMANAFGAVSAYHSMRRGLRKPTGFDVRYYSLGELRGMIEGEIGSARVVADCFLGLGLQASDLDLMNGACRIAVRLSEAAKKLSFIFPPLTLLADSVYVEAYKRLP